MKSRTLALRVAGNSALMILMVYVVMQTVVFLRDCVMFNAWTFDDLPATVFGFVMNSVVPPLLIFTVLLWLVALRIQKTAQKLEAGVPLAEGEAEKTRHRMLRFRGVVLAVNVTGFVVGFLLLMTFTGRLEELGTLHQLTVLGGNLCAALVFSAAQNSLNNVAFAPLRDQLGITSMDGRKRETSTTVRQTRLTMALVFYALFVMQYNQHDATVFQSWGDEILKQVQAGTLPADQATPAYRELLTKNFHVVSIRNPAVIETIVPPWESDRPSHVAQEGVFLLFGLLMCLIAIGVQTAVGAEQKDNISTLQARIRDVVAGGGDLRKRLSLRSMDDLGELAELVNRLLDQFQTIVGRIGIAAGQTREGARAVEAVLTRAEEVSTQVGASVAALKDELEDQANQARQLSSALGAFREAAAAVDSEASTQSRFVAETSAAMDEMATSIEGVREKSREAGSLTEALSRQGEGGGQAVKGTTDAITGIHRTSLEVLDVLGALKKIAADTNLLAMNAAIEAAHAGEKGAGFAVVADEVRQLANTAQSQTKAIKDLILAMARQVEVGVDKAKASGTVLADLVKGLQDSAQVSRAVAEAMEEQAGRTRSVGSSLGQVVRTSDTIRAKMTTQGESTDRMSESLGITLDRLAGLVATSQRQATAVSSLEASFTEVRREVDRNAEAAETLRAEIGRFQV